MDGGIVTTEIPPRVDVGIVGGGIIGLAVAHELAERGREVVVLDHGARPGNATHASAGMIAPVAEADVELPGLCEFRQWSHQLYPEFVARVEERAGVDCSLRRDGTLLVALDRDHTAELERLRDIMQDQGFEPQPLNAKDVLDMEPGLSARTLGGLLLEQDDHIDQRVFVRALRIAVEKGRGRVFDDVVVERVTPDGAVQGHHTTGDRRFELECEQVVVAAGSWSNVELDSPVAELPLRPVRGQVVRLHAPALLRRVVRTPDVYMVPHAAGELVLGASVEEQGFDVQPTAGAVFELLRHAWRALPGIYDLPLKEISVGFRPVSRDHLPVIGRLQGRVCVATGHFRNGILLAPGTARLLGLLLCDAAEHALLGYFEPQRFAQRVEKTTSG
jgi:glycine oxidase